MGKKCCPGLNRKEMLEQCPDLIIDDSLGISDEEGWFKKETMETLEEITLRQKDLLKDFKKMHLENPNDTFLLISHGAFLINLMLLATN